MQRSTVEKVIDKIGSALGPNADVDLVEKIASDILSGLPADSGTGVSPSVERDAARWVSPLQIIVHVSLSDCTSRLPATIVAKAYDKIRRSSGSIPTQAKRFFQSSEISVPRTTLALHGTVGLLEGFRASECLEIAATLEQGAIDSGFDCVNLLDINLEHEGSQLELLKMVPAILKASTISSVRVQLGSSTYGIRALELYALAETLLSPDASSESTGPRISVNCNAAVAFGHDFRGQGTAARLDLDVSVWPLLDTARNDLPKDACFGDRLNALGSIGRRLYKDGACILDGLCSAVSQTDAVVKPGLVSLCLDAPGDGPGATGIWAGFPVGPDTEGSASRTSAIFLREALLSDLNQNDMVDIVSDGLPVSYSLRNIQAAPAETSVAELAGQLLEIFTSAVRDHRFRAIQLVPVSNSGSSEGVHVAGVSGIVSVARCTSGWLDRHFSCGGTIVPPPQRLH